MGEKSFDKYIKNFNIHRKEYLDELIADAREDYYEKILEDNIENGLGLCVVYDYKIHRFKFTSYLKNIFNSLPIHQVFVTEFLEFEIEKHLSLEKNFEFFDDYVQSEHQIIDEIKDCIVYNSLEDIKVFARQCKLNKLLI